MPTRARTLESPPFQGGWEGVNFRAHDCAPASSAVEPLRGYEKGRSKGLPFFVILPIVWLDDVLCSRAKLVFCTCCSCKFACRRNSMCKISNRVAVIIYKKRGRFLFLSVGVTGFEPVTLWSQTRCANRTALHPVVVLRVQR